MVSIVLSVVVHLIGNKIIDCYFIFTSKCEISFPVTFNMGLSGEFSRSAPLIPLYTLPDKLQATNLFLAFKANRKYYNNYVLATENVTIRKLYYKCSWQST